MSDIRVYCAVSLDGFIAGSDDDLSWLGDPDDAAEGDPGAVDFAAFLGQTGAILMGRRTYDIVAGFGGQWPYGSIPVLVATSRPLTDPPVTVNACHGDIRDLCAQARELAGDLNVYLDGGGLVTQALEAGCVDAMILTVVPVLLGSGVALYRGESLRRFEATPLGRLGQMQQTKLVPSASTESAHQASAR